MTRRLILPLFLILGALVAWAQDLPADFLGHIVGDRRAADRTELVGRVSEVEGRDAAKLLLEGIQALSDKLDRNFREMAKLEKEHEPLNTNVDVAEDDYKSRDALRKQIADLDEIMVDDQKIVEVIEKALLAFASEDARAEVVRAAGRAKSWRGRAAAARASAIYPGDTARDAALKALTDKEPRVAVAALEGLATRADETTVEAVAKALAHDVWVVQVAAADALAAIGSLKGIRPLIEALAKTRGRVQSDLNRALKKLTGENFDPDYEVWKRWYEENRERIEGAGAKPLRGKAPRGSDPDDSTYYGIQSKSRKIVYVLDVSGSMTLEIGGKGVSSPRPGEEEKASGPKIEIAKKELKSAIRKLPEDATFNIITFNHLVKVWSKTMVKATQANKNKAYLFIRDIEALGSTYTYGALKEAFQLAGMGATDPNYDSGVDTIFLLSDGAPTDQTEPQAKLMDPDKILDAVRQWNKLSKIVIHAIAIDPKTVGSSFIRFMRDLAQQNGGQYTERG